MGEYFPSVRLEVILEAFFLNEGPGKKVQLLTMTLCILCSAAPQRCLSKPGEKNARQLPVIIEVFPKLAAESAGIKSGDMLVAVEHESVSRSEEAIRAIHLHKDALTSLSLKRGAEAISLSLKPNGEGKIGVRISDMNDAIVAPDQSDGAPLFKTADELSNLSQSLGLGNKNYAQLLKNQKVPRIKPNCHVRVLYEQPVSGKTSDQMTMCKLRLEGETPAVMGSKLAKGDWFTLSRCLQPAHSATEHAAHPVTNQQAQSLKADMMLPEVRKILASQGVMISQSDFRGVVSQTWLWQNANGSSLCCNFEDDRLIYKSAYLLR